jgi:hypothetical protein
MTERFSLSYVCRHTRFCFVSEWFESFKVLVNAVRVQSKPCWIISHSHFNIVSRQNLKCSCALLSQSPWVSNQLWLPVAEL